jgi:hypothetical protein
MWNHRIKWIAGSTVVAGALLATALASHAQAATPCKAACLEQFRHGTQACIVEGNCGRMFQMCRTECIDTAVPGPDRNGCLAGCRSDRLSCRQDVASCRAESVQELKDCKDACDGQ